MFEEKKEKKFGIALESRKDGGAAVVFSVTIAGKDFDIKVSGSKNGLEEVSVKMDEGNDEQAK